MKKIRFIKKDERALFNFHDESIPFISYKCMDDLGFVKNAITLRNDSSGTPVHLYRRPGEDLSEITRRNEQLMSQLGTDLSHRVSAFQKHTANVHVVKEDDLGSNLDRSHITFTDGLITDIQNACLIITVADCIPLCFADPVNKVIGLAHSGRVGTLKRIGAETVRKMHETFGSDPADIIATIGPGICQDCYEVGPEIYEEFKEQWGTAAADKLLKQRVEKYLLDLWTANQMVLLEAGLKSENITTTNICNRCNLEYFYSFRGDGRIINQICVCMKLM